MSGAKFPLVMFFGCGRKYFNINVSAYIFYFSFGSRCVLKVHSGKKTTSAKHLVTVDPEFVPDDFTALCQYLLRLCFVTNFRAFHFLHLPTADYYILPGFVIPYCIHTIWPGTDKQ